MSPLLPLLAFFAARPRLAALLLFNVVLPMATGYVLVTLFVPLLVK